MHISKNGIKERVCLKQMAKGLTNGWKVLTFFFILEREETVKTKEKDYTAS